MAKKATFHAKELSKLGASKGGIARSNVLTPGERKEIARMAVKTRWAKEKGVPIDQIGEQVSLAAKTPAKQHTVESEMPISRFPGTLTMGGVEFSCHVLSNGKRVFNQTGVTKALTGTDSGDLKSYLTSAKINTYLSVAEIAERTIDFKIPGQPRIAKGYEAELLVEICDAYLKAREDGVLLRSQLKLAKQAEIIMRSYAKVGIIALIDEATGYQQVRAKNALRLKLKAYIADEMQEWVKMFPDEFFFELARLESVTYSPRNRPLRWGKYIMMFIYDAIDPDVAKELKRRTPNPHKGENLHQWLTEHIGKEKLVSHLNQVIGVMKACRDMADFRQKFKRIFEHAPEQLSFWELTENSATSQQIF